MKDLKIVVLAVMATVASIAILSSGFWLVTREAKMLSKDKSENESPANITQPVKEDAQYQFLQTLSDIDRNLEIISNKEGVFHLNENDPEKGNDGVSSMKDKILNNIHLINALMDDNKEKIDRLKNQLSESKMDNTKLDKLVKSANFKIELYESEMDIIKKQLLEKDFQFSEINEKMSGLELRAQMFQDLAEKYENDANKAFFTSGTIRELKKEGVLEKEGGLFGIGGAEALKKDFREDCFSQIDIRKMRSIPVNNARMVKLVTSHPKDSYEFKKLKDRVTSLDIVDPEKFWKASKYMVLAVK